jgi:hypothetical protein
VIYFRKSARYTGVEHHMISLALEHCPEARCMWPCLRSMVDKRTVRCSSEGCLVGMNRGGEGEGRHTGCCNGINFSDVAVAHSNCNTIKARRFWIVWSCDAAVGVDPSIAAVSIIVDGRICKCIVIEIAEHIEQMLGVQRRMGMKTILHPHQRA